MKSFKLAIALTLLTITGCTALDKVVDVGIDKVASKLAPLIVKYCDEINPDIKMKVWDEINAEIIRLGSNAKMTIDNC